jgi:hypothetical protein
MTYDDFHRTLFDLIEGIRNQIQVLEAQSNQTHFRKQIDVRIFAYHVPVMRSH